MFSAVEMTYLLVIIFTTYSTNVRRAIKLFSRKGSDFLFDGVAHLPLSAVCWLYALCETQQKVQNWPVHSFQGVRFVSLFYCEVVRSRVYQLSRRTSHAFKCDAVILKRFRTNLPSESSCPLFKSVNALMRTE